MEWPRRPLRRVRERMPPRFLDTNVLIHHLTHNDEAKARLARDLLLKVERGEEKVITSPLVIFETAFILQRLQKATKESIRMKLLPIILSRNVQLANKRLYQRAFDVYVSEHISFADAYNVAYMEAEGISEIYSWDTDFDKLPGITRIEPAESE